MTTANSFYWFRMTARAQREYDDAGGGLVGITIVCCSHRILI